MDDAELAQRCLTGFGEVFAVIGKGYDPRAVVRWRNAVGARVDFRAYPRYLSSVVVPAGEAPPQSDPGTYHVWSDALEVPGRIERPGWALDVMGVALTDEVLDSDEKVEEPSLEELVAVNERAYGKTGCVPLAKGIDDPRVRSYGFRVDGEFACVAATLSVGDDLGIHYLATEEKYRRRGLANSLIKTLLAKGQKQGMRSATLVATKQGKPLYERNGFRRVGTVRPYIRGALVG